jgi:hypothetical protein
MNLTLEREYDCLKIKINQGEREGREIERRERREGEGRRNKTYEEISNAALVSETQFSKSTFSIERAMFEINAPAAVCAWQSWMYVSAICKFVNREIRGARKRRGERKGRGGKRQGGW